MNQPESSICVFDCNKVGYQNPCNLPITSPLPPYSYRISSHKKKAYKNLKASQTPYRFHAHYSHPTTMVLIEGLIILGIWAYVRRRDRKRLARMQAQRAAEAEIRAYSEYNMRARERRREEEHRRWQWQWQQQKQQQRDQSMLPAAAPDSHPPAYGESAPFSSPFEPRVASPRPVDAPMVPTPPPPPEPPAFPPPTYEMHKHDRAPMFGHRDRLEQRQQQQQHVIRIC